MKKITVLILITIAILVKPQITYAATPVYSVQRLAGNDRIDTSITASKKGWSSADTVILTESGDYADALAATPLAVSLDAPILLTAGTCLDSRVISELQRLKAKKVILLGGKACLTSAIESKLDELKLPYERIGGYDRYETSTLIALRIKSDMVIVAYGDDFPDALASASFAGIRQIPIILITDTLPDSVVNYFKTQKPSHVIVVGGEAVVPTNLLSDKGISMETRLGGVDRYETSAKIYDYAKGSYTSPDIFVASGEDFSDAMVGTVVAAKNKSPLLITMPQSIPVSVYSILVARGDASSCHAVYVLGGTAVISAANSSSIENIGVPQPVVAKPVVATPAVANSTVGIGFGIVTASPALNLRQTAVTTSAVLATIPMNTQVEVISQNASNWYNVVYNGQSGWVSGAYLRLASAPVVSRGEAEQSVESRVMRVSAYTIGDKGMNGAGITASGEKVLAGRTIAADSSLSFGTQIYIPALGKTFTVTDRGSAITGDQLDIYMESLNDALNFGTQELEVQIKY